MALNTEGLGDRIGIVKLLTIILGIVTLGFIGHSYYKDGRDEAYLSCVIICFIISFLWAVAIIVDLIHQTEVIKKIDMIFHMIATAFYVITLICFTVSLIKYSTGKNSTKYRLWERVFAFIFGVITATLYGFASWLMFKSTD